ncbi:Multidrug resistance protein [Exophiala xenobiotica]|nr:Multidrug resistance protein [Exophiala xenobiotica]KAK5215892.1 Multidrug resistance protein [Exophiala xenobiotica]KAK5219346.1 Multidrug resistance protein [Exophiala xenobiotica]KAK5245936.1 Multidrug resistance protein [Exophiala xenobiotica]KAK5261513.1 Multidrug resistance protein [Exophiala xenobiotica]
MALAGYVVSNYDRTLNAEGPGTPSRLARRRELDDDTALPGNQVVDEDSSRVTFSSQGTDRDASTLEDETVNSLQTASQRRGRQIRNLARQYTHESAHLQTEQSLFNPDKESNLDPSSDNFDPTAWTRTMFELRSSQQQKWWMGRSAGFCFRNLTRIDILQGHDGLVQPGELLVVLGPPGSGCTTFLKTLAGDTHGYHTGKDFHMNYQGISWHQMHKNFRGEAIYTAEQDVHFPQLTVGDTLYFAAQARAPRVLPPGITKGRYAERLRDVVMATFGIRHTIDTKVGNEYVRGVSGGERKRVTIAEAALSGAPLQCWDNSTRGLDSANAIEFCKTLRLGAAIANITAAVSIYQAP